MTFDAKAKVDQIAAAVQSGVCIRVTTRKAMAGIHEMTAMVVIGADVTTDVMTDVTMVGMATSLNGENLQHEHLVIMNI